MRQAYWEEHSKTPMELERYPLWVAIKQFKWGEGYCWVMLENVELSRDDAKLQGHKQTVSQLVLKEVSTVSERN